MIKPHNNKYHNDKYSSTKLLNEINKYEQARISGSFILEILIVIILTTFTFSSILWVVVQLFKYIFKY